MIVVVDCNQFQLFLKGLYLLFQKFCVKINNNRLNLLMCKGNLFVLQAVY